MNLSKLFEMQAALDTHIEHEHPDVEDRLEKKILALLVELGELANEWRGFKFWSNDQESRHEKMLEEYVDCLHFILSIGNEIGLNIFYDDDVDFNIGLGGRIKGKKTKEFFINVYKAVIDLQENSNKYPDRELLLLVLFEAVLINFMALGFLLGFTQEQIEQAYIKKNEINHQRQLSGY